jgi:DNA-directed RNA polymerase specialized sigma24 family protein
VPEPALSPDAQRMRLVHAAARRREAVTALRIAESTCSYLAGQLADGLSPAEARSAALETSVELVAVAEVLRRAVRLSRDERRVLAAKMMAPGRMSARQVADRLGVSERTVWRYLGHP